MFTHLHVHSCYSLLDSSIRLPLLVQKAKALGFRSLALTDHFALYGIIDFYDQAKKEEIHPIIGVEVYFQTTKSTYTPLILLCQTQEGYRHLCHIVSHAFLEQEGTLPAIKWDWLERYRKGLVCLSTGIAGPTPHSYQSDQLPDAVFLKKCLELFGKSFFLEFPRTIGVEGEQKQKKLYAIHKELKIPLVATEDVHLLTPQENEVRNLLIAICAQERNAFHSITNPNSLYLASAEEMAHAFSDFPEAIKNTERIAEMCQFDLQLNVPHLPTYPVPDGNSDQDFLRQKAYEGAKARYGKKLPEEVRKRLDYELDVICKKGFASYFLIIHDIVRFCRNKGIPVGPGRGSAAGSLVSYCLFITQIDPIKYGLIFERFLNPERMSLPDIDMDISDEQRHEVMDFMVRRYGKDRVANIVTFGTMAARAAVRDTGRAMGVPLREVDRIAKLIPPFSSLSECLQNLPELKQIYQSSEQHRKLLDMAGKIEGFPRHTSTHAAGIVLAPEPLMHFVPLQKGEENQVQTQYAMQPLEKVGLLKMDILGLRNLSIIGETIALIKANRGETLDINEIPLNDKKTFALFREGETSGVFQMESEGMRSLLKRLAPERLEDLIAVNALYRPGPLKSGMVDDFIKRRRGLRKASYLHPSLEPILNDTYGVILYQEQVMQIAHKIAGFSMGEADDLRKAMGKKIPELLEKYREPFVRGVARCGIKEKLGHEIYDLMEHFGGYGFNKSHSTAYALIAYQTAYLKAHYPLEFMTALLQSVENNTEQVFKYAMECRRMGLKLLPPDINKSQIHFQIEEGKIRTGLITIKNVGKGAEFIVQNRLESGRYADLIDLMRRVKHTAVNKKLYESLILSGALDSLHSNRRSLYMGLEKAMGMASVQQRSRTSGQGALFESSFSFPEVGDYSALEKERFELDLTGILFTPLPFKEQIQMLRKKGCLPLSSLISISPGADVMIGGAVLQEQRRKRYGDFYHTLHLTDGEGVVEILLPDFLQKKWEAKKGEASLVAFQGKKKRETTGERPLIEVQKIYFISKGMGKEKAKARLHLKVPREKIESVKAIKKYTSDQGNTEVVLHLQGNANEKLISLGERHRLLWNPDARRLIVALFGEKSHWIETIQKEDSA